MVMFRYDCSDGYVYDMSCYATMRYAVIFHIMPDQTMPDHATLRYDTLSCSCDMM